MTPLHTREMSRTGGGEAVLLPPSTKLDWGRAIRAMRKLIEDRDDTLQVFEIMQALNAKSTHKGYLRLIETVGGARIAYEREELVDHLMDLGLREGFAPGTVGAAYREFVEREDFSAEGLAKESERASGRASAIHFKSPISWYGRRIRDVHDIWHVIAGYGRDGLGEACIVAFSYRQTGGLGWAFIALTSILRQSGPLRWQARKAIVEAFVLGGSAQWLPGQDYVALLHEPLEIARRRLSIQPPRAYDMYLRQTVARMDEANPDYAMMSRQVRSQR